MNLRKDLESRSNQNEIMENVATEKLINWNNFIYDALLILDGWHAVLSKFLQVVVMLKTTNAIVIARFR